MVKKIILYGANQLVIPHEMLKEKKLNQNIYLILFLKNCSLK